MAMCCSFISAFFKNLSLFALSLEHVPISIFELNISVGFVINEHSVDFSSVCHVDLCSAYASSLRPFAFVIIFV